VAVAVVVLHINKIMQALVALAQLVPLLARSPIMLAVAVDQMTPMMAIVPLVD
jgi:hypothetical protein